MLAQDYIYTIQVAMKEKKDQVINSFFFKVNDYK